MTALLSAAATLVMLPWLLWARNKPHAGPRKTLVMQLGKIGDLVCTTPLLRALAERGDEVTVLCLRRAFPVLANNPHVHSIIHADDPRFRGAGGRLRLFKSIRALQFDCSIAVLPGVQNAMIGLWSGAWLRIHTRGRSAGLIGGFLHSFHEKRFQYERGTRTFDHYMTLAAAADAKPVPYAHEVYLTEAEKKEASDFLRVKNVQPQNRIVILSLTAGNPLKEWPLDRFVEVAKHLVERGWTVLLSSSDKVKTAQAVAQIPGSVDIGGIDLRQLAAVIACAKLFVSVDTGPLYIAHALNVPVVDIVGPVDPREQPPPAGPTVTLVIPPSDCHPTSFVAETLRVSIPEQRQALESITSKVVIEAIDRLIGS